MNILIVRHKLVLVLRELVSRPTLAVDRWRKRKLIRRCESLFSSMGPMAEFTKYVRGVHSGKSIKITKFRGQNLAIIEWEEGNISSTLGKTDLQGTQDG